MEVRAKKALGQHFLTDQKVAKRIVGTLSAPSAGGSTQDFASLPAGSRTTIPLHPQGTGGVPPDTPCVASLHNSAINDGSTSAAKVSGAAVQRPSAPTQREWEGPAPSGVGGIAPEGRSLGMAGPRTEVRDVLEIGPGMGVLTQYLLQRDDINLKAVEVDGESVDYLLTHFAGMQGKLLQADYLRLDMQRVFKGPYRIIGNFPYNISSQIFFKILDDKDRIPEVVCMIQKEVAERIAEKPGSKTYGILSVLLQAWYDIEYCFTVGPGAFAPPPKVQSAVIRLTRNGRTELGCDEKLFKQVVKTAFNQRRKTLRNALKPLLSDPQTLAHPDLVTNNQVNSANLLELRAERLSVEDFIRLTQTIAAQ